MGSFGGHWVKFSSGISTSRYVGDPFASGEGPGPLGGLGGAPGGGKGKRNKRGKNKKKIKKEEVNEGEKRKREKEDEDRKKTRLDTRLPKSHDHFKELQKIFNLTC